MDPNCEPIVEKKTHRTEAQKRSLMNRLHRIQGQLRGLEQLLENDAYCNELLQQSAAARSALDGFNQELLSNHIHGCVTKGILEGDQQIVDELLKTLRKLMK